MTHQLDSQPGNDFPKGLSRPAIRALSTAGFTHLEQLTGIKEAELLKLHGMGPKAIGILRDALNARGQAFADSQEKMGSPKTIYDSPTGWVRSHIQEYVASNGQKGHLWRGMHTLLLTTRGRKSGKLRRTGLIYGQDGQNYLLVASNGGSTTHPLWYLNLVDDPMVEIQVGLEKLAGRARTASAAEKPRMWNIMSKIFPQYDKYQAKAVREIPLVIVEPISE